MVASGKHNITDSKKDFTKVSFKPDLSKFKMTHLNKDIISLMTRRVYDIAGCTRGVAVYLNGNKLPVSIYLFIYCTVFHSESFGLLNIHN